MEFRWRNGSAPLGSPEAAKLEVYAAKFPELGRLDQFPLELIAEEYRVRRQWGDRPTHTDFLARFPVSAAQLELELLRVDRELEDERLDSPAGSQQATSSSEAVAEADPALLGQLLSDRDVLLRRMIGAGRMGKVYEAWRHSACRAVAVKFLRKSFLNQPTLVERFIGEARTIARLRHPNIVAIHGLGRTTGGSYFIVMDLVTGPNLALVGATRPILVDEAIRWTIEICRAVEHAHAAGIIHCDLKPANVLLDDEGKVHVTDFGFARAVTQDPPWAAGIEGTAPFMAPEQVSRSWGPIDVRTDIYGIGAVLFTFLTGRPPWIGRRLPDILADVASSSPVIPPASLRPDLPKPISDLCRRCLAKVPSDRYPTVMDLRTALTAGRGG
jgi:tRNA A-37 threonylcarbamoyl transferase component Bud32